MKEMKLTGLPHFLAGLLNAVNSLVEALTGLERILSTPIPYSCVPPCAQIGQMLTATFKIFNSSLDRDGHLLLLPGTSIGTYADRGCLLTYALSPSSFGQRSSI
jgi:hypothetical protein